MLLLHNVNLMSNELLSEYSLTPHLVTKPLIPLNQDIKDFKVKKPSSKNLEFSHLISL